MIAQKSAFHYRYVRLVNDTFRLSLMIFIHAAIITVALLLQQITDVSFTNITGDILLFEKTRFGEINVWYCRVASVKIA